MASPEAAELFAFDKRNFETGLAKACVVIRSTYAHVIGMAKAGMPLGGRNDCRILLGFAER